MSTCIKLMAVKAICGIVAGGINRLWLYDPEDFDFTQAAPVDGNAQPYTAIAAVTDAPTGAYMFRVEFEEEEADYKGSRADNDNSRSIRWEHLWNFTLSKLSHLITQFLMKLDVASTCCGIGLIFQMNDGTIWVAGEKIVNGLEIESKRLKLRQGGTELDSGRKLEDPNVANVVIKGSLQRPLFAYAGTVASIIELEEPVTP